MSKQRKTYATYIVCGVLLMIFSVVMFVIYPAMMKPSTSLWLGDGIFQAETALNDEDRANGLSDVSKLNDDQALLMAFASNGKWNISIKDMKVPVDIIWLNQDKKIVYIVKNASPDTSGSLTFTPKYEARYVVELPAGSVDSKAINLNMLAIFQINEEDVE